MHSNKIWILQESKRVEFLFEIQGVLNFLTAKVLSLQIIMICKIALKLNFCNKTVYWELCHPTRFHQWLWNLFGTENSYLRRLAAAGTELQLLASLGKWYQLRANRENLPPFKCLHSVGANFDRLSGDWRSQVPRPTWTFTWGTRLGDWGLE